MAPIAWTVLATQCSEIIDYRAGSTSAASDSDHLMCVPTRLDTLLDDRWVGIQVFIQKKVPDHGNPTGGKPIDQVSETFLIHAELGSESGRIGPEQTPGGPLERNKPCPPSATARIRMVLKGRK